MIINIEDDYEEIVDINSTSYTDLDLQLYDTIFEKHIGNRLAQLVEIDNKYQSIGSKKVVTDDLTEYFEKLFIACCPTILKCKLEMQQVYQLHLTSLLLIRFNDKTLHLSTSEFNDAIYFPNLINLCAKYLINARRYIHRTIKSAFVDFKDNNKELVTFYTDLYELDDQRISNDINYFFLGNVLTKFDPIKLVDINSIYFNTIQRMFYFYLKSKISKKDHSKLDNVQMYDYEHINTSSERYCLYEEALYLAQLYRVCETSNVEAQIKNQLGSFKKMVITNEFQKLFMFNIQQDTYDNRISNFELLQSFYEKEYDISVFKSQTPLIYRLLRSIHVKNTQSLFSETDIEYIKPQIQSILKSIFSNNLNAFGIESIIPKITDNLINRLLTGEYIDMMTMTVVNIPIVKFTNQLKLFLQIILNMEQPNEQ